MTPRPLRVALLAYRGNPHSGGQGVYTRYLQLELEALGHHVDVISGQPYPELAEPERLVKLPSLDLYRPDRPFRPHRRPRTWVDWLELGHFCTAAFPEPLSFSLRAAKWLGENGNYDIVHDNQCLGYGMLSINKKIPVLATVHHPITVDKRLEMERSGPIHKISLRRWYSFIRMQQRVAKRLPRLITVSQTSRRDIIAELGVDPDRIDVVPVGVDAEHFRPRPEIPTVPGRILAVTSSDVPLKGLAVLLEAIAKLRTEREHAHLVVIGRQRAEDPGRKIVARFGIEDAVEFTGNIDQDRFNELYAQAEVAVVPSLYEGFSLPAIQALSSGIPLVATMGGAIPEVAGTDGETALLVPTGDAAAIASAAKRLLDSPELRAKLSRAGRERVFERFTWAAMARGTAEQYERLLSGC